MKVLVPLKRVADPDHADQIRIAPSGDEFDTGDLEGVVNPFDHCALEAALRLTEDGRSPRQRSGEIVLVTVGPPEAERTLRHGLAAGADRAIRVEATDAQLDGLVVSRVLARVTEAEHPDLVLLGKQTVDGDANQVGQRLGELLDWPVAAFAVGIIERSDGLVVERLIDGGILRVRVVPPAVITVDLAILAGRAVRSLSTPADFVYGEGVRFASLLAARQAQKKPIAVQALCDVVGAARRGVVRAGLALVPRRPKGRRLATVTELVATLVDAARLP